MSTDGFIIDDDWTDLSTLITIVDDTRYIIQNTGHSFFYLSEAASQPSGVANAHKVGLTKTWGFTPEAGKKIWVKSYPGEETRGAVTEG